MEPWGTWCEVSGGHPEALLQEPSFSSCWGIKDIKGKTQKNEGEKKEVPFLINKMSLLCPMQPAAFKVSLLYQNLKSDLLNSMEMET